jgi:tRNA pseudouridine38-40 synthase
MRYFIELQYDGTGYSGFQVQENAVTIQSEVEKALATIFRQSFSLTGSSRTDAGVHALQNYFHFDTDLVISPKQLYNLNALLPATIAVRNIHPVKTDAHCRFDAIAREYHYHIHRYKDPFRINRSWFYPYAVDIDRLNKLAAFIKAQTDFESFSKRNTQVHTFQCRIAVCEWTADAHGLMFVVKGNRFLRGMVRGLVSTMLKLARQEQGIAQLSGIFDAKDCSKADFTAPGHGLFLSGVQYPDHIFTTASPAF